MLIKANKYKGYTGLREKEVLLVKTGAQRVRELLGQALATEKNRRKILFKYFFKNRQFLVVKTHKMSAGENSNIRGFSWQYGVSSPEQIRTAVSALRGRRPRPLDDGAGVRSGGRTRTPNDRARTCCVAYYTTPEGFIILAGVLRV